MIRITGTVIGSALKRFPDMERRVIREAETMLYRHGAAAAREAATYPPQPSRTRAKTFNTYVRGVGRYPKSAFTGAQKLKRGARTGKFGVVKLTSQRLGTRWTVKRSGGGKVAEVRVGNAATYAPYVQAREPQQGDSRKRQTGFHRATGWRTIEDIIERRASAIRSDIAVAIATVLNGR